jgi:hypothetical protein
LLVTPVFYILITRLAQRLNLSTIPPAEDQTPDAAKTGGDR